MTSQEIPWQFQWKRPQWQVVDDEGDNPQEEVEGTCLGMVSALVASEELRDSNKTEEEDDDAVYMLNVTVVSSPFCVDTPPGCGDLLVLEIIRQSGPASTEKYDIEDEDDKGKDEEQKQPTEGKDDRMAKEEEQKQPTDDDKYSYQQTDNKDDDLAKAERLTMKVLRWPGVALQKDLDQKEGDDSWRNNLPAWLGGTPQRNRSSPRESAVGVVGACLCRKRIGEDDKQKAAALDALDTMTFLSLGMDPEVQTNTKQDNKAMSTREPESEPSTPELLLACLCSDGCVHIYSPWKLLQLSEASKKPPANNTADAFANSMSTFLLGDYVFEQLQSSIWPLSQPEATVKLTIPMPRPGQPTKKQDDATATTTTETTTPSSSEKEPGESSSLSLWDRSVWDPQVDPFTAIYRTKDNIPTHCISAFEYIVIAGRGKRVRRPGNKAKHLPTDGGFITLLSLQHFSEVRTLFLPFVPNTISPFVWGGMQFLFVIGDQGVAVAIRVDISVYNSVICGEAPSLATSMQDPNDPIIPTVGSEQSLLSFQSSTGSHERTQKPKKPRCFVHRFQILPIVLPETISDEREALSVAKDALLFGSSPFCSPPAMVMVSNSQTNNQVLVHQSKLEAVDYIRMTTSSQTHRLFRGYRRTRNRKTLAITTSQESRRVARILVRPSVASEDSKLSDPEEGGKDVTIGRETATWCHLGQGWCLVGIVDSIYFICWEGATSSEGPFVCELKRLNSNALEGAAVRGLHCGVMPVDPYTREAATNNYRSLGTDLALPFTQNTVAKESKLHRVMSGAREKAELNGAGTAEGKQSEMDSLVAEAIQSISMADYEKNIIESSPQSSLKRKSDHYSHREKSIRLLRKCSAWSQLDDTRQNRIRLGGQVPVVNVRLRNHICNPYLLTLRRIFADSGVGTPFHQILSWLSQKQDYFTAASVALDLKKDAATLKHLWRSFERIDEDDERTKLEGLLDGIIPIHEHILHGCIDVESDQLLQMTLMQLADMTIGCLCRGGFAMSSTLEFFLQQDTYYDGSRTCLVLAAIAAQAVADEEGTLVSLMGKAYEGPSDQEQFAHDILWPVRCLLQVGVSRKILPAALALINAAVPNELRQRQEHKQLDSMMLCATLVKLIIGSSPDAIELLLDLVDEEEGERFWSSLSHETQTELALVPIDDTCPLLRQPEIRSWALHYLQRCLQDAAAEKVQGPEGVSMDWLRRLCSGCLVNAACDTNLLSKGNDPTTIAVSCDGLEEHVHECAMTREALIAGSGSGGLDFNLLIPALLLLEIYKQQWNEQTLVSTQAILNASCSLAGRVTVEEPLFAFDGASLMKQCTIAGNICAGANLVGGKNGLILECCWILIECCGMSMEDAELFLRKEEFKFQYRLEDPTESEKVTDDFVLNVGHKHVLWLLEQHVLQVKTFGEFDSTPARGKVHPVSAAEACLWTWYLLTKHQIPAASKWLANWLRRHLGMEDDCASRKRLACAALAQVLLWSPGPNNANVLAEQMKLESSFLVELSQACWNLVEAVPPGIADEILAQEALDTNLSGSPRRVSSGKATYIS